MTHRPVRMTALLAGIGLAMTLAGLLRLQASAGARSQGAGAAAGPLNFGFPMGFSVEKMDRTADPKKDFVRYAAGKWIDAAVIPADTVRVSSLDLLARQVQQQIGAILAEAVKGSATAAKGTPLQQVGDFYASGMDVAALTQLGVAPIKAEMDAIAVDSPKALASTLSHFIQILNEPVLAAVLVSTDPKDRTRYAVYAADGELPMGADNYLKAEAAPVREAYRAMVAAKLAIVGYEKAEAARIAAKVLEIETRVARKKLTPVQQRDPNVRFVRMPFAKAQALLSNIDLPAYLQALGLPPQDEIIVSEVEALRERNAMLKEYSAGDTRDYLRWELVKHTSPYLTPAFQAPTAAFAKAVYGYGELPAREKRIGADIATRLGHPLSQLYVARHFSPETRKAADDLVARVKATFRARLAANTWLSADTRRQALEKLDALKISVGYPNRWIDYSGVEIRRDDYLGNVLRLNAFSARRELARFGKPVMKDEFAQPGATQPIDVNAAYALGSNGIEIPAAFLQPPFYDPKADAAVNYGALGAVIGHEITHGFDSTGRLYDATGNVRNWWTEADGRNFVAEAQKLVAQGNAWEVLPGLHVNGALAVGENLADVGGVSLAYEALGAHLRDHPDAARAADGMTPQQRFFLTWAQVWADKAKEGFLKQVTPTDPHPPGLYRMASPSQHEKGFYEAFGIKAGDPMWLPEKDRVAIW